ncbi:hypothetical protein IBZ12_01555 [Serratia ureilytica]|uniref:hypothetical protein n=1 Tax=Serratia ureilytica TaxID=300181 RepID=UPI0039B66F90
MTEHNEDMVPMTPAKRGVLRSKAFWGVVGGIVMVCVLVVITAGTLKPINQRLAVLEQSQKTMTPQDDMNAMADKLQAQAKQLNRLAERQDALTRQMGALTQSSGLPEKLEQQLQAQQVELNALKDSIESVKIESVKKAAVALPAEKTAPAVVPSIAGPSTAVPPAPSATAQITPKHKPTPMKPSLRNAVLRVAHKAPFVLTGVEQRGTSAFAAVAPQGFSDLSQVRLIGEGESVAGWILVSAGYGQATFRVNGRLQTVSAQ